MTDIAVEGVVVGSYEAAINHMYEFVQRKSLMRHNYVFLFKEQDGSLNLVERLTMPCWGAIREYNCGTRPDDYWPHDLREPRHIFPKTGNPIAVAFQFHNIYISRHHYSSSDEWNRFMTEFVFNPEISPWKSVLGDYELVMSDGVITGFILKDTSFLPTTLANMLKYVGRAGSGISKRWCELVDKGYHPLTVFLNEIKFVWPRIIPERYFNLDPIDMDDGGTFFNRTSYNRPDVEKVFGGKDNKGILINSMSIDQIEQLRIEYTKQEKEHEEAA